MKMYRRIETGNLSPRIRWLLAANAFETSLDRLARLAGTKFNPGQPRVPAGQPDGGQWTNVGGAPVINVAARRRSSIEAECETQYERDLIQCRFVGLPQCYAQAMKRRVACQQGDPIPPLNY
jgi:hypothetical protein